jgi:hypothetical protein
MAIPQQWPYDMWPLQPDDNGDLVPDETYIYSAYQLRPDNVDGMLSFTGGFFLIRNGGQAVSLPFGAGVVTLGNFAVRTPYGWVVEPADGFFARYMPVSDPS